MKKKNESPEGLFACTVTVGEKGQFVIPKQARDMFDIKPGDALILLGDINKGLAIPPKSAFEELSRTIFGKERGDDKE